MSPEFWIGLIAATLIAFFIGRRSASKRANKLNAQLGNVQAELDSTLEQAEAERAEARDKAAAVEDGVSSHFEQSAVLFGKLAQDYRAFFEHFSASAQELGVSEGVATQLLAQLDQPLISETPETEATIEAEATEPEPETTIEVEATAPDPAPDPEPIIENEPPILDPISARVAEIEHAEATQEARQVG